MSRPLRLLFPAACALLSVGFSACVGTIYDRTYSNKKTYFKKPAEKKEASANDILKELDKKTPGGGVAEPSAPGLPPPPAMPGGEIPGLPPAEAGAPMAPPPVVPPAN